jgi:hypothetical protein
MKVCACSEVTDFVLAMIAQAASSDSAVTSHDGDVSDWELLSVNVNVFISILPWFI